MQPIQQAREAGLEDDEILSYIQQKLPHLEQPINEALKTGYGASEVLDYINNAGPSVIRKGQQVQPADTSQQPQQQRGFLPAISRGFKGSVSGLVGGAEEQVAPEDQTFTESLGELAGGLAGDVPAMLAGGAAGGAVGSAVVPGLGTAVGAGAGSFALPAIIKQAFTEYRDYAKQGGEGTFAEFLERVGSVGAAGIKGAVVGGLTSQASRLLPVLKRMPRFEKLLNTRLGKAIEEPAAELATLTAAEAGIERKIPSPGDIGRNVSAIAGFRLVGKTLSKAQQLAKDYTPFEAAARVASKKQLQDRMQDKNVTEQQQKILEREIRKREAAAEARKQTKEKLYEVGKDFASKANELLPENAQRKATDILEKFKQRRREKQYTKAMKGPYMEMLEKNVGKRRADLIRSHYKWKEALDTPIETPKEGKPKFLSQRDREDMLFYRQKTGNPNVEGDTFEKVKERLPEKAKKIVDETIAQHFDTWRDRWNENPATLHKINPREGLEEIYLPGVYEETSKTRYTEAMKRADEIMRNNPDKNLRKQFQLKGPFANKKVFETYHDAITKAGLKPRYKDIGDLMRYHDELMIRLENNNELMQDIRNHQKNSGEKVFVNSNKPDLYKEAKKNGWVEFDDTFLRQVVKGVDENGKPIFETSPSPALVNPAAAKALQGIFNKKAFRPDHPYWAIYDSASALLKTMRVSLSPFHIVALGESGIGGMGLDFFKGVAPLRRFFSENWWDSASQKFNDTEGLAWRADMGLSFKAPDTETYKEGQRLLQKATDAATGNLAKKGVALLRPMKNLHRWIFEEYQPRLKVSTFDLYYEKAIRELQKQGKEITPEIGEQVARDAAKVVNNQFGGQIWETIDALNLNDPTTQKWMRRIVGYPDWSVSALRQAADAFAPGTSGKIAREYWVRYVTGWLSATYLMRFLYGGFKRDDKDDKFSWSVKDAYKALDTKDPKQVTAFPLPDIELKIGGTKFNPGRDERGRRIYSRFGKQMLEIPRYFLEPLDAAFSKSNPIIQAATKQMLSGTPFKGELFPARPAFKGGEFLPWDATRPGTVARAVSRGKELVGEAVPFSLQNIGQRNVGTMIATGFGGIPTGKGLSLKGAETYMYDALRRKDPRKLKKLIDVLKDNGYEEKQIRARIQKIKKFWVPNENLDALAKNLEKNT